MQRKASHLLNEVMKLPARMRRRSAMSAGHRASHGVERLLGEDYYCTDRSSGSFDSVFLTDCQVCGLAYVTGEQLSGREGALKRKSPRATL